MKINSNIVTLEKENYEKIENIIKKIASENGINEVESIQIKINSKEGSVNFNIRK